MTPYEFGILCAAEQIDLLYKEGVYVGKRRNGDSVIVLYQLDSFYVEVFYRKYRCFVNRIQCFTSTMHLNPYLEQIDVEDLVKC